MRAPAAARGGFAVRRRFVALATALLALVGAGSEVAAAPTDERTPLRIVVMGDLNGSYGTIGYSSRVHAAVRQAVALEPDLVVGIGDMIAGQRRAPRLEPDRIEAMWEAFDREVLAPLTAAGIPFAPVAGNHDASAEPEFALEREAFARWWRNHRPALDLIVDDGYPFDYGLVVADVLLVILDATRVGPLPAVQRDWLQRTLATGPRGRARLVAGHLPIRAFTSGREREVLADARLEEVLRRGGVDVYLSGHHHAFYPGFAAGILQVSQGCLGSGPRRLIGSARQSPRSFTVVEIRDGGGIDIRALAEPDFTREVERGSLPPVVQSGGLDLLRDDIARPDAQP